MKFVKKISGSLKRLKRVSPELDLILIAGVTGGGTTLMSGLLDQYFQSEAILHESQLKFGRQSPFKATFPSKYSSFDHYEEELLFKYRALQNPETLRKQCMAIYKKQSGYNLFIKRVIDKAPNYHLARIDAYYEAFPKLKTVVIFRDPRENVEGLVRKWPLFREAGVERMAQFWTELFNRFMDFEEANPLHVIYVNYDDLLKDADAVLDDIQQRLDLTRRKTLKKYPSKADQPGKALRNVKNGEIQISTRHNRLWEKNLSAEEIKTICNITQETYNRLLKKSIRIGQQSEGVSNV